MLAHALTFAFDRRSEQPALVAELIIDRDLGNMRVGRHLFDRGRGKAMVEKRSAGGVEDRLAFYQVDRALRTRKGFA